MGLSQLEKVQNNTFLAQVRLWKNQIIHHSNIVCNNIHKNCKTNKNVEVKIQVWIHHAEWKSNHFIHTKTKKEKFWKNRNSKIHLLGVKANLCLHSSQYSFLLCLSHWTKLQQKVIILIHVITSLCFIPPLSKTHQFSVLKHKSGHYYYQAELKLTCLLRPFRPSSKFQK